MTPSQIKEIRNYLPPINDADRWKVAEWVELHLPELLDTCLSLFKEVDRLKRSSLTGELPLDIPAPAKKAAKKSATGITDEWLDAESKKHHGINIQLELEKATAWCGLRSRKCTRKFFQAWLFRVDPPAKQTRNSGTTNEGKYVAMKGDSVDDPFRK